MAVLTVLLPSARLFDSLSPPLCRWLARGERLPNLSGRYQALRCLFQIPNIRFPVAALVRSYDAQDANGELWLRADPVYLRADLTTVRMLAWGNLNLSSYEVEELARSLKPVLGDYGLLLEPLKPSRWYLRCAAGTVLPDFSPPEEVIGDDLSRHFPTGESAKRWQALHNETQIILHNHPINTQRLERGQIPANGLWFWGGGKLPDWVKSRIAWVVSEDPLLCALARCASISIKEEIEKISLENCEQDGVIDLGNKEIPSIPRLLAQINEKVKRQAMDLMLIFNTGQRWSYRPIHRWRFWRKAHVSIV